MSVSLTRLGLALCLALGLGCATTNQQPARQPQTAQQQQQRPSQPKQPMIPGSEPAAVSDPLQPFNRAMFYFNDQLFDRYLLGPVAHGWLFISPETVRRHLEQAFDNLNAPGYVVQPLLQGDPRQSGVALGRFVINTTVGIGGFFDPAHHYLGLARRPEDFGQTLGVWGVPSGPYLVLPIIWPRSTVRDFLAYPVDVVLNVGDGGIWQFWAPWWAGISVAVPRYVNRRALVDADLNAGRAAAVDWYSAARDAYLQGRARDIRNGAEPEETPNDDLYEIDPAEDGPN